MLEFNDLERLRRTNKALLECLKGKQEEFRHRVPSWRGSRTPSSLNQISGVNGLVPNHRAQPGCEITSPGVRENGENRQTLNTEDDGTGLVRLIPCGLSATVTRAALCSPKKPEQKMHEPWTSVGCEDRGGKVATSQSRVHETDRSCNIAVEKPPGRQWHPLSHVKQGILGVAVSTEEIGRRSVDSGARSTAVKAPTSSAGKWSQLEPAHYEERLLDDGNNRQREQVMKEIQKPKSILPLSHSYDTKKGTSHVMFQYSAESPSPTLGSWEVHPLLGYDWIAGLLEIDSSMAEKSEQYFSELNEFRRVNQEECIHMPYFESQAPDFLSLDDGKDLSLGPHQCVFCYRVNMRLFPVPLGPESACPVCKGCRSKQPESVEEPAYVRVSIPRSTLLPPHKYRSHRRRSFEPSDSLALPLHCLAGWENTVPSSELTVTSLDLRNSVEPKAAEHPNLCNLDLVSRVSGSAQSDHLLNLSRSAYFQLSKSMQSGRLPKLGSSVACVE